jgi:selenocysteine-specific elongation factor
VKADRVEPGARCAVNLQGVEVQAGCRGQVVSAPGALAPTHVLDAQVSWLEESPAVEGGGSSIEFLAGTAERVGRIAPIAAERLLAGANGFARIHLEGEPVALLPGDRFVVRGFSRSERWGATLGGGRVLDVAPPHRRRSDPELERDLATLLHREPRSEIAVRVARAGFRGVHERELHRETGLSRKVVAKLLAELAEQDSAAAAGERWLSGRAIAELQERILETLDAFHAREPLRPGMPRAALRGALPENSAPGALDLLIEGLAHGGSLVVEAELVRRPGHRPQLTADEEKVVARIREDAHAAGLEPPTLREWSEKLGLDLERVRPLLVHLEREGDLVRAPGDLWFHREAIEALRRRVVARIRSQGPLDTPTYKQLIGTTRKHAVPLMELLDAERLTLRKGETRVLRGAGA